MGNTLDNFIVINPGDECGTTDRKVLWLQHFLKNSSIYAGNARGLVDLDPNSNVDIDSDYSSIKSGQDFDELPTDTHAHLQILKQPCCWHCRY